MLDLEKQILLVIAPHPDDEIFGCGGLMWKIKKAGGKVYVLYLTVGVTKDYSKSGESSINERELEIKEVNKFMQLDGYRMALPGNDYHLQLDSIPQKQLIHEIERGKKISIEEIRPTILAIPSLYDYNQDHRATNRAALTATRPVPPVFKYLQPIVLEYEFPYSSWVSESESPSPDLFVELNKSELDAKLKALRLYKSQLKVKTGPLSEHGVKTLAHMRGIQSGSNAAEAYVLRRYLIKNIV